MKEKDMLVKTEDGKVVHGPTLIQLIHKLLYFSN
jgi:hypothetical protein